jgi:hypothetical protein
MNCFAVDETNAGRFLSQRRKTPSLLFVHIEAFSYAIKFYLRRSIFEAFSHQRYPSPVFAANVYDLCHDEEPTNV